MKKVLLVAPLLLVLYACNNEETKEDQKESNQQETVQEETNAMENYVATTAGWVVDDRLQEPTEDTVCEMCNMKVYTKDHEMGVFSAQAIKADGSIAFYDDIGCLLNAEFANEEVNDKYVRDYVTLNWMNVEQAFLVKTELKSPMNWGYIFFKYEEDAQKYISENEGSLLTSYTEVRQQALERRKANINAGNKADGHDPEDGHVHGEEHNNSHMETEESEHEETSNNGH